MIIRKQIYKRRKIGCSRKNELIYSRMATGNITVKRRANWSQTTGERLASSIAWHGLVRLALA